MKIEKYNNLRNNKKDSRKIKITNKENPSALYLRRYNNKRKEQIIFSQIAKRNP